VNASSQPLPSPWLNPRRIRVHAILLALCLWTVCAVDYATPGIFDRAGNIKFQDFIQFPISARLITQGRVSELYDTVVLNQQIRAIVGNTKAHLEFYQAPQVVLPFLAMSRLPFLTQATLWLSLSLLIYFACVYELWKTCSTLRPYPGLVSICAVAYPPLFHFFVRGQLSVLVLLCFTCTYLAFRAQHDWLAGIALGCLIFKPQFLVAIPFVLLVARAWKPFAGVVISAAAQLAIAWLVFGRAVMQTYISVLLHHASQPELSLSPDQMHSLRSFWVLLIPLSGAVWVLYVLSSVATIALAAAVWKSSSPLALRFSALNLAAVLVNPHLFVYDLLALVPVLLLAGDWALTHESEASQFSMLLYLAFVLPLFGPLSRWTHIQLSVIVFVALLWIFYRDRLRPLASRESRVV
jgi:Glycosyltransferase family 87